MYVVIPWGAEMWGSKYFPVSGFFRDTARRIFSSNLDTIRSEFLLHLVFTRVTPRLIKSSSRTFEFRLIQIYQ